jgi:tRNA U34 5-carboxymethylaminomethyl modifying GTPase MnmE/TrmE
MYKFREGEIMFSDVNYSESAMLIRYVSNGAQLLADLDSAIMAMAQPLRITTCGLLKAGKSSLLNALTDHLETELFATGAVRTIPLYTSHPASSSSRA